MLSLEGRLLTLDMGLPTPLWGGALLPLPLDIVSREEAAATGSGV